VQAQACGGDRGVDAIAAGHAVELIHRDLVRIVDAQLCLIWLHLEREMSIVNLEEGVDGGVADRDQV